MQGPHGSSVREWEQPRRWGVKKESENSWLRASLEHQDGVHKQMAGGGFTGGPGCHQVPIRGGKRRGNWEKSNYIGALDHLEDCTQPVCWQLQASGKVTSLQVAVKYSRKEFLILI